MDGRMDGRKRVGRAVDEADRGGWAVGRADGKAVGRAGGCQGG
jgi:hypothetical protein